MGSDLPPAPGAIPGYSVRPAAWNDLAAVAALVATCDIDFWGTAAADEGDVRDDWARPRFDLTHDTWVVMADDGAIVGYASLYDEDRHMVLEGWGTVHPAHRGRGIGSLLVSLTEARAQEHLREAGAGKQVRLRAFIPGPDEGGKRLLEARGYRVVRRFWHMEIDLGQEPDAPPPAPPGIQVRKFVPGQDEVPLHAADEEAFGEHWGYVPTSFEEWALKLSRPMFDPSLWYLATDGDDIAGFLLGEERLGIGWVGDLGVRRPWRGRGLARHLLRHAFDEFRRRGYPRAGLTVDSENTTGATRLYESVGMRPVRSFDVHEKVLNPG
jgi:mycothiol synthase